VSGDWIAVDTLSSESLRAHLAAEGLPSKEIQPGLELVDCPNLYWGASITDDVRSVRYATVIPVRQDAELSTVKHLCQTVNEKHYWPKLYYLTNDDGSTSLLFELAIPLDAMGHVLPEYLATALRSLDEMTATVLRTNAQGIHAL